MFPCPHCNAHTPQVLESRFPSKKVVKRRRYECQTCKGRFTTYERLSVDQAMAAESMPIQELELGAYAYDSLKRQGITTVDALVKFSGADLLSLRNFGQQSLDDVRVALALRGLALRRERASP
jgi:DNA-directed RNA polymerase alpha subunit